MALLSHEVGKRTRLRKEEALQEFKHLEVLSTSEGNMEREMGGRIAAASAVMRFLHPSVMVKKQLSPKAKLMTYRPSHVPTLTCGQDLWTERTRLRIQAAKMKLPL